LQHLHRHLGIRLCPAEIDEDCHTGRRPGDLDRLEDACNIGTEPALGVATRPGERHGIADHLAHHIGRALCDLGGMRNDDDPDVART